ncbi:MAG TPA: hypothetical protein VMT20_23800, partial [Terriglobia bacterium]|nr:hypothetical protein [Terriglobia bacterium]
HVVSGWVTVFGQRMGNTFPAICLGKRRVRRNSDGDLSRSISVIKPHLTNYADAGASVEKQLINGLDVLRSVAGLGWPMDCMWRIGFSTGPISGG